MRILVVDSDPREAELLTSRLEEAGHEVVATAQPRRALELALADRPEIIVVDGGNAAARLEGLELCRSLRRSEGGRERYVLMLLGDDEGLVEALEAGIDDYILKPFAPADLIQGIRRGGRIVELQDEVSRSTSAQRRRVAELAVQNRKLRRSVVTDEPTGLPNRRYAEMRLEQDWEGAERAGRPLSILMIEIDFGPERSVPRDAVLRAIAEAIPERLRESDLLARFRGQAFLVICPETNARKARRMAGKIGATIREALTRLGLAEAVTARIGAATRGSGMTSAVDLRKAADEALRDAL